MIAAAPCRLLLVSVAQRCLSWQSGCAADASAARFCQAGETQAQDAPIQSAFFHARKFMAGCVGSPSGERVPVFPSWQAGTVRHLFAKMSGGSSTNTGTETMTHPNSVHTPDAQTLFNRAFPATREPRSEAYKAGVLAAIKFRLGEAEHIDCPYRAGSVWADAFHAGADEGHVIARNALREVSK